MANLSSARRHGAHRVGQRRPPTTSLTPAPSKVARPDAVVTLGPGRERSAARASTWRLLVDATVRAEPTEVAMVVASGVVWMVAAALVPAILGRAIDRGVVGGDTGTLMSDGTVYRLGSAFPGAT